MLPDDDERGAAAANTRGQRGRRWRGKERLALLRAPPVELARVVRVGDRARRGARLHGVELAANVLDGVLEQRRARRTHARLAEVHVAEFVDEERACTGAALPVHRAVIEELARVVVVEE